MKLRNKKTGVILEDVKTIDTSLTKIEIWYLDNGVLRIQTEKDYHSFLQNWEDYDKPAEPLITDEKIRKAVRAWAEAVGGSPVCFYEDTDYEGVGRLKIYREGYPAVFDIGRQFYELELDTQYTIDELCGEEE